MFFHEISFLKSPNVVSSRNKLVQSNIIARGEPSHSPLDFSMVYLFIYLFKFMFSFE